MTTAEAKIRPTRVEHRLGEIDDDGNRDSHFRYHRYVCACGKAGPWRPSEALARGDHAVHVWDVEEPA